MAKRKMIMTKWKAERKEQMARIRKQKAKRLAKKTGRLSLIF